MRDTPFTLTILSFKLVNLFAEFFLAINGKNLFDPSDIQEPLSIGPSERVVTKTLVYNPLSPPLNGVGCWN